MPEGNTVTVESEVKLLAAVPTGILIDGHWRKASDDETSDVEDPATGKTPATPSDATSEDAFVALDAADKVQPSWARTAPNQEGQTS